MTYLNQWIQPDPIVPDPFTPADWNRYAYVRNNPVNYTDPSGMYAQNVHLTLTHRLAQEGAARWCPSCLQIPGNWLGYWIARGDQHVDDAFSSLPNNLGPIETPWFSDFHFRSHDEARRYVRLAIDLQDPYLFGAALHGLQDYWSHTYEGYAPPLGHGADTLRACRLGAQVLGHQTPCRRFPQQESAILVSLWTAGEISRPDQSAFVARLAFLGPEVRTLTTSNLFDVWLRIQPGAPNTRRAGLWKAVFGYDTDAYYPFAPRDQAMEREVREALSDYFERAAGDMCLITSYSYEPPGDAEIVRFLRGGND